MLPARRTRSMGGDRQLGLPRVEVEPDLDGSRSEDRLEDRLPLNHELGQSFERVLEHAHQPKEAGLFGDINELKRGATTLSVADSDLYNNSVFGKIARSKPFEYLTLIVISLNAIEIGVNADVTARWGMSDNLYADPVGFIISENSFAVYFSMEMLVRAFAYKRKLRCLCDAWFVFDAVLVIDLVAETWIIPFLGSGSLLGGLSILRLCRLLRITRMVKLMRAFPQLMTIIQGLAAAARAVMWTAILMLLIVYTGAIVLTNQFHQGTMSDEDCLQLQINTNSSDPGQVCVYFGSMGKSIFNLLVRGTLLDDITNATTAIRLTGNYWMLAVFILSIVLNSFTMMNMLVGILVEVVGSTAEGEKKRTLEEAAKESIKTIFRQMDQDNSGMISRDEFMEMKHDHQVMQALKQLDIKDKQFDMYVNLLFRPSSQGTEEIGFQKLLDCICRLRPGTAVSALDFATFKQRVCMSQEYLKDRVARIDKFSTILGEELPLKKPRVVSGRASPVRARPTNTSLMLQLEAADSADLVAELRRRIGEELTRRRFGSATLYSDEKVASCPQSPVGRPPPATIDEDSAG